MGRYITTIGTAGTTTREISTTFSASVNDRILATQRVVHIQLHCLQMLVCLYLKQYKLLIFQTMRLPIT